MDVRENLIALINSSIEAQIISQADLLAICGKDECNLRDNLSAKEIREEIAYYVNKRLTVSAQSFTAYMTKRGFKFKYMRTLDKLLTKGVFDHIAVRKNKKYYVRNRACTKASPEDIVL